MAFDALELAAFMAVKEDVGPLLGGATIVAVPQEFAQ